MVCDRVKRGIDNSIRDSNEQAGDSPPPPISPHPVADQEFFPSVILYCEANLTNCFGYYSELKSNAGDQILSPGFHKSVFFFAVLISWDTNLATTKKSGQSPCKNPGQYEIPIVVK